MAIRTETQLGLTFGWKPGDGSGAAQTPNWHLVLAWLQSNVMSIESEPPIGFPLDAKYLVSDNPTASSEFELYANHLAWNDNGTWRFFEPKEGFTVRVLSPPTKLVYQSAAWAVEVSGGGDHVPYHLETGQTWHLAAGRQAVYHVPIELDEGAYLNIEGCLIQL